MEKGQDKHREAKDMREEASLHLSASLSKRPKTAPAGTEPTPAQTHRIMNKLLSGVTSFVICYVAKDNCNIMTTVESTS